MTEDKDREKPTIERVNYWKGKVDDYLKEYSSNFEEFIHNDSIRDFGNELLINEHSRGFNYATLEQFPLISKDNLIFYGIYIQRSEHICNLLAGMESCGIISKSNISFGIRAAKVIGDWDDPECVQDFIETQSGKKEPTRASVEAVLIFHPSSEDKDKFEIQVAKIVDFLRNEAPNITGGYQIPDIRATATDELKRLLLETNIMKSAVANLYKIGSGSISTLKQESSFEKQLGGEWKSEDAMVNPELHEFLSIGNVLP
jgi:hypothetical protein